MTKHQAHQFPISLTPAVFTGSVALHLSYYYGSLRPALPDHYQFGWYWESEGDIDRRVRDLQIRGRRFNVWETPQFAAVERLVGVEKMPFPADLDPALYGTFIRIVELEVFARQPGIISDFIDAEKRLDKATNLLVELSDTLFGIREEVHNYMGPILSSLDHSPLGLGNAQRAMGTEIGLWNGVLKSEINRRKTMREKHFGSEAKRVDGRTTNWVAEFVAVQAADIYRTVFKGKISQATKNGDRPSFRKFLEDFSQGYPEAENADHRALARRVWGGEYEGDPFAPI